MRVASARSSRSVGRAEAAGHLGLLHLPVDALLPGGLLLGLQLGQPAAGRAEVLVESVAGQLALHQRGVDLRQPLLGAR